MIEININGLGKFYGANRVFKNISFSIKKGERIGLIGPNGCGKTTIFRILAGQEDYQEGQVSLRKGIRLGYLDQMPVYEDGLTVDEVMALAFKDLIRLKREISDYESRIKDAGDAVPEGLLAQYGKLCQKFEFEGGYEIETNINKVATGLNISDDMRKRPYSSLSGGEKTRVELAKVLLESPDVLLLDEPSNHLDMKSIEWLEDFLKAYKGSALIVSHDRYFLDRVVTGIIELSFDRVGEYNGNYSYYVVEKERRFLLEMKYYEKEQREIKRMEEQIKRYRVWGAMRGGEKMFKRAKELEKRLARMERTEKPVFENKKVNLGIKPGIRSGKRVLELKNVSKAFEEKKLLGGVDLELIYGDSLCIIGDNGTGKSTLLKIIAGEAVRDEETSINPGEEVITADRDEGGIKLGSQLRIGYLPQDMTFANENMTILEYFQGIHNVPELHARNELAKVLFIKDDVYKKIGSLSGGEKSRLKLCSLLFSQVNLLMLDEPTNHLDIDSREILEEVLEEFEGTILFVSHDRYFISRLANRIGEIKDGKIRYYEGNYNYYRERKEKENINTYKTAADICNKVKKTQREKEKSSKNLGKRLANELAELELSITELENKLNDIGDEMQLHATDAGKLLELFNMQKDLQAELDSKYMRWSEVTELIEREQPLQDINQYTNQYKG
jgi:ATP-binding cassette subfamily F protein 3